MSFTSPPPGTSSPAKVAVVIVNWNTRDLLRACLLSLLERRDQRLGSVIVVDNASRDGSAAMVKKEFPGVHLIEPGSNTGYAQGNNIGISATAEPYLLLLNPDTEVEEGSLDRLAAFLDTHPTCAVVAPQLLSPDGSVQRSCRGFPTPFSILAELLGLSKAWRFLPALGAYRMMDWGHDTERQVDQPMASAMMVRRGAAAAVGLMDEQFPLFFNEVDWLFRLHRAGWEIWFTPTVRVMHHHGSSTRQVRVRAAWLSHTGMHSFYRKHYRSSLNPVLYRLLVAAIYLHAAAVVAVRFVQQWYERIKR